MSRRSLSFLRHGQHGWDCARIGHTCLHGKRIQVGSMRNLLKKQPIPEKTRRRSLVLGSVWAHRSPLAAALTRDTSLDMRWASIEQQENTEGERDTVYTVSRRAVSLGSTGSCCTMRSVFFARVS